MKPPIAYYGGKSRLARWVAQLFPPHRVYVEPFAGSAAVLFAKPRAPHEILNDVDGHVVNFFRVLREQREELELLCRLTPYARDEFAEADLEEEGITDLERARRFWVRTTGSFAKTTHGTGWSTSINQHSNQARSALNRIGRFAPCAERLMKVSIENRDALEVLDSYADPDGVAYVDPPYLMTTRSAMHRRPRGDYRHEFATEEDHRALAEVLHRWPGSVFLSGYPSDLYLELYADWDFVERKVIRNVANLRVGAKNRRGPIQGPHTTEVVWSNRPLARQLDFDETPARRPTERVATGEYL